MGCAMDLNPWPGARLRDHLRDNAARGAPVLVPVFLPVRTQSTELPEKKDEWRHPLGKHADPGIGMQQTIELLPARARWLSDEHADASLAVPLGRIDFNHGSRAFRDRICEGLQSYERPHPLADRRIDVVEVPRTVSFPDGRIDACE